MKLMHLLLLATLLLACVKGQTIRLVSYNGNTSSTNTAGRLEVYYNGQWGTVCDDSFGASEARTVCRQLGYTTYISYGSVSFLGYMQASSFTPIWLDNLSCSSTATNISQCSSLGYGVHNCGHHEDVAVSCILSNSSTTISTIRLVTSSGSTSSLNRAGRLEVYYSGGWASVCSYGFGASDARAACRQLGFTTYSNYGTVSSLGYTSASYLTPIWPDEFLCTSSSTRLSLCSTRGFNSYSCSHSQDIAISCSSYSSTAISLIRLVSSYGSTSSLNRAGRLEVYYSGGWASVCSYGFGASDARAACRQLGFTTYNNYGIATSLGYSSASSSTPIWPDEFLCTSSSTRLSSCSTRGYNINFYTCSHSRDVGISCTSSSSTAISSIRLVSSYGSTSSSNRAGRLEVYYSRQWGTVCSYGFGASDARAACRQLGFTTYSNYGTVSSLGYTSASSSTPIWPDEFLCTSFSTRLSSCRTRGYRYSFYSCSHSRDVAISCSSSSSSTSISSVRLVTSSGSTSSSNRAGRLEVYYSGGWASVCSYGFGASDARAACRQLGFTTYSNYGTVSSLGYTSASSLTPIWPDEFLCTTSSTRLSLCSTRGYNIYSCSHSRDVAISCSSTSNQLIRLVSSSGSTSSTNTAGRLEVYYSGQWGTVCNDSFAANEARTACRQLGYTNYTRYGTVSSLGYSQASSSTPIWLDELSCSSTATSLNQCSSNGYGNHDCGHSEDVALSCYRSSANTQQKGSIAVPLLGCIITFLLYTSHPC